MAGSFTEEKLELRNYQITNLLIFFRKQTPSIILRRFIFFLLCVCDQSVSPVLLQRARAKFFTFEQKDLVSICRNL